ncbi:hypothetical protein Tco_0828546 [Tanacetum coccineum]
MTENLDISRRILDNYHRVQNDDLVKNIFNSGKNKDGAGMKIPDCMLTEAMKLTDHYKVYAVVFWVDVPTTQSQPIESTQGTHRTPSAPRSPNPVTTEGESRTLCKSTVIRFHMPRRQDLETPITIATENVEQVKEHIVDEELDHLLDGTKNVDESPEVENDANMVIVNANKEEEESDRDKFELKRRVKGKGIEETRSSPPPTTIRSLRTHVAPLSTDKETLQELTVITEDAPSSADKEKLQELTVTDPTPSSSTPLSSLPKPKTGSFRNAIRSFKEMLHSMVNKEVNKIAKMFIPIYVVEGLLLERQKTQADIATMIVEAIQKEHDNLRAEVISHVNDAIANHIPLQEESSVKRHKISEHGTYSLGESSSGQAMEQEQNPSGSGTQEQLDESDAWMEDVGTDDDEVPDDKVT